MTRRVDLPVTALTALSSAVFVAATTEFLPGGLLPNIAEDLGLPLADAGLLISVFALTVVLSATPLALLTRRVPRKLLVLLALTGIGAANALTAAASSFDVLLTARVIGGLSHGMFWSVVAAYPAYLVPAHSLGRATAVTTAGGSLAGVLGIPLGNLLGQQVGWRLSFAAIALLALVLVALLALLLPPAATGGGNENGSSSESGSRARRALHDPTLPRVAVLCAILLLVALGQLTFGTFAPAWTNEVGGIPRTVLPVFLFASGLAGLVGVFVISLVADRFPLRAVVTSMLAVLALQFATPLVGTLHHPAALLVLFALASASFAGLPLVLQAEVLRAASPELRSTATAVQTTAINIGIGGGAALGAVAIERAGLAQVPLWSAAVLACALVATVCWILARRFRSNGPGSAGWTLAPPAGSATPPGAPRDRQPSAADEPTRLLEPPSS